MIDYITLEEEIQRYEIFWIAIENYQIMKQMEQLHKYCLNGMAGDLMHDCERRVVNLANRIQKDLGLPDSSVLVLKLIEENVEW